MAGREDRSRGEEAPAVGRAVVDDGRPHRARRVLSRALAVAALLAGACTPKLATGGFRCTTDDPACPTGQHCSCGLCVEHDHEAACSFDVAVDGAPLTVREHQPFRITITARAADSALADGFDGTVDLGFSLGDGTK